MDKRNLAHFFTSRANSFHNDSTCGHFVTNYYPIVSDT
jgi:hypothetical protein